MNPILLTAAGNPDNQDRGLVLWNGPHLVLCVADGAGGRSGGTEAATLAVAFVRQQAALMTDADGCAAVLRQMDAALANDPLAGETTCALTIVTAEQVFGASVGDSGAWLLPESGPTVDLTHAQQRKPLLGSGAAWPVSYRHPRPVGGLLLATDGLLKYTSAERILRTCREHPPEQAAKRLIDLVRSSSGTLPDDVTLILTKL